MWSPSLGVCFDSLIWYLVLGKSFIFPLVFLFFFIFNPYLIKASMWLTVLLFTKQMFFFCCSEFHSMVCFCWPVDCSMGIGYWTSWYVTCLNTCAFSFVYFSLIDLSYLSLSLPSFSATILHASVRTPNLKARLNTFREEFRAVWRNYSDL